MWLSKVLDIVGAITYIFLLFLGIKLGFKNSFRIFLFILFITLTNTIIYRIFKMFIVREYLEIIDVGVVTISSVISFFIFHPIIDRIYHRINDIDLPIVSKMIGFLIFVINGVFIIGYFVIFSDLYPQLYYFLETSSFLRIMSNIVKFALGIIVI
ncbi:MAG: hypothetical protein ACK4F9_02110 [Brevinematia bacterium]